MNRNLSKMNTIVYERNLYMPSNRRGFTLVELLIGIALSSLILMGAVSVFTMTNQSYNVQDNVVEAQQFVRSSMEIMTHEIRMAGYLPPELEGGIGSDERLREATATAITFLSASPPRDMGSGTTEEVRYAFTGTTITRSSKQWNIGTNSWDILSTAEIVSENISGFVFSYIFDDGTTGIPASATRRDDVRGVYVTIIGRSADIDPGYTNPDTGDSYHYRTLTTFIKMRNMGL